MTDGEQSVQLADPGLDQQDPRQVLHGLLEAMGLTIVLMSDRPVEDILAAAAHVSPVLRNSTHLGRSFMRLEADPNTMWAAIEGLGGSAVLVFGSPESDMDLMFSEVMLRFESAPPPFARELVTRGSAPASLARLIESADLVPPWEFPSFTSATPADGYPVLPITARRAARDWERLTHDLYKVTLSDPEPADVFLSLHEGRPELLTPVSSDGPPPAWVHSLVARGMHRLEILDQMALVGSGVPAPIDSSALYAAAVRLVSDLGQTYAEARGEVAPQLPPEHATSDVWTRLEAAAPEARLARAWSAPTVPRFTYVENVRFSPADETEEHEQALKDWLAGNHDAGWNSVWRSDDGGLLSPNWLSVRAAVLSPASGRVAIAGHLSRERTGWFLGPPNALYFGSLRTGALVPIDASINVVALDLSSPTGLVVALHHLASGTFAVSIYGEDGARRLVTVVDDLAGNETIRFSPDGAWLLIPRWDKSILIEVVTGRTLVVGVGNTSWWPLGESSLLSVHHQEGTAFPALFSLRDNLYSQSFPRIELNVPLLESFPYVWSPVASVDGETVLADSPAGVTVDYQSKHGVGSHLLEFNLSSGRGSLLVAPFINSDGTIERDVRDVRWTDSVPPSDVFLHPDLAAALQEPILEHPGLRPDHWADEAEQFLVGTLNAAIDRTKAADEDLSDLMPEVLSYLRVVATSPASWRRQQEWLVGLRDSTTNLIASGTLVGRLADYWRTFGSAIEAGIAQRSDLIDPLAFVEI